MEELKKTPRTGMEAAGQQTGLSLAEAEKWIVQSAAGSMIEIGYYLKQIRDARLYEEKGYKNIWEYAEAEFGFHKSTASRYMTRNDRFSKGGNSPELDERYIGYSKSQLQEMLSLDDEQMGQVTPDMTVGKIRQIRKAEEDPDPQLPGQMEIGDFLDPEELAENGANMMQEEIPEEIQPGSVVLQVKDLILDNGEDEGQQVGVAASQQNLVQKNTMDPKLRDIYLNEAARKIIANHKEWLCQDFDNRVLNVTESEKQFKQKFRNISTSYYFPDPQKESKIAWMDMFGDYIQIWNGNAECLGDVEWFYLCAAVQSMWNTIAIEDIQKCVENGDEKQPSGKCIHRPEFPCTSSEESKRTPGNGTDCTHHCCWDCSERGKGTCRIECYASAHRPVTQEAEMYCIPETEDIENAAEKQQEKKESLEELETAAGQQEEKKTDLELLQIMYEKEKRLLNSFLEIPELDAENEHLRRQELTVKALKYMLGMMSPTENPEMTQPELPLMKNNDQRKEWLQAYRDWGVWYTDENIGATYYKYDFENGARLIVEEYENIFSICGKEKKSISEYYHLVGGPEPSRASGIEKWTRHERYTKYPNSETELVEFLKEVQRK